MKRLTQSEVFWAAVTLLALVVVSALTAPDSLKSGQNLFLQAATARSLLNQVSFIGVLAVGMTFVILTGGIDLAVGSLLGLSSASAAILLMDHGWSAWSSVALVIGLCAAIGALQGALVAAKLQPFIVTLAGFSMVYALARIVADDRRRDIRMGEGGADAAFGALQAHVFGWLPVSAVILAALVALAWLALRTTVFGRNVYAVGGNERAAHLAGVPVGWVLVAAYVISGACSGLAGAIYLAQYEQGNPDLARSGYELDAIAAVVVGGTRLTGGRGSALGTLVGVLLIGVLNTTMGLHDWNENFQKLAKGAIILLAALSQHARVREFVGRIGASR